jgi:hypothetical protein
MTREPAGGTLDNSKFDDLRDFFKSSKIGT